MADDKRDDRIVVCVTGSEKRKFETLAEKRYTNLSELVRQLLYREVDTAKAKG